MGHEGGRFISRAVYEIEVGYTFVRVDRNPIRSIAMGQAVS